MTGVATKKKRATGYMYEITYIDPADLEGMKSKTWRYKTLKEAKDQQEDLAVVWRISEGEIEKEIPIRRIGE